MTDGPQNYFMRADTAPLFQTLGVSKVAILTDKVEAVFDNSGKISTDHGDLANTARYFDGCKKSASDVLI